MEQLGCREKYVPLFRRIRGEELTPHEAQRRTARCQHGRQKLLRRAVANSTNSWVQREYGEDCELPELIGLWRQQTGGEGDFDAWAHSHMRGIRAAQEMAARPTQASAAAAADSSSGRRSASEPRHSQRQSQQQQQQQPQQQPQQQQSQASTERRSGRRSASETRHSHRQQQQPQQQQRQAHRRRSHSAAVAVPLMPATFVGPFLYVAHPLTQAMIHASVPADDNNRSQMPESGPHHNQPGHAQPIYVLPPAVPVYVLCDVAAPAGGQHLYAGPPGQGHPEAQDRRSHRPGQRRRSTRHSSQEPPRRSPRNHAATRAADSRPTRPRTLPGNFAELQKTWEDTADKPVKSPSRNIRL